MEENDRPCYLRSAELAKLTRLSKRYPSPHERIGVLPRPGRTPAGYRQYPVEAVKRVRMVQGALALGFSLKELGRVLRVRDRGGAPCRQVHALAMRKLAKLDRRIAELTDFWAQLQGIVQQWATKLQNTPDGQPALLLETLIMPLLKKESS